MTDRTARLLCDRLVDVGGQDLNLKNLYVAVLAAIAYHQPINRDGQKENFANGFRISTCPKKQQ